MSGERSPVRMRTVAAHSGAAFEAGQLGHRNGAAPEGIPTILYCYWAPGTFLERSERLGLERVLGTFRTQAVCRSGKLCGPKG